MITLLTDFGTADYFVGAMKGVILSIDAEARIFDITHEIPAYDIAAGAFTLLAAYQSFPTNTIHVAVVDPGVGSERRPVLVSSDSYFFVGPDNGLFSYIFERETSCRVYHLTNEGYFRHPVSPTFHGRDIFASIAGALSTGVKPDLLGSEIKDFITLAPLATRVSEDGTIEARIIHIDHYGNCITNLTRDVFTDEMIAGSASLQVGDHAISSFRQFFAETNASSNELFCFWGSAGFLEIAAFRASAAKILSVERGHTAIVAGLKSITCHP